MKINADITRSYLNEIEALHDMGFNHIGIVKYLRNFKEFTAQVVEKNGKKYYVKGMEHFNTTIYNITLGLVDNLNQKWATIW